MGTKYVHSPQINMFAGGVDKPKAVWFDDGLTIKNRMLQEKYVGGLIRFLQKRGVDPKVYHGVSESVYDDSYAIVGNWNKNDDFTTKWIEEVLEIQVLWSDEWSTCGHCYKAVKHNYMWLSDCEIICINCLEVNWDDWGEDAILTYAEIADGHTPADLKAFPSRLTDKLELSGFLCLNDEDACEVNRTGLHVGDNDDPQDTLKQVSKEFPDAEVIFVVTSSDMFTICWATYVRYKVEE